MEEKEKVNWFPNTDKQDAEKGGWNPSMQEKGYEEVSLVREDIFNDFGRGSHPGQDRMPIREVVQFMADKFSFAAEAGHLPRTYKHYVEELRKADALDDTVLSALVRFTPEVEKADTAKKQKQVSQEIAEYLGKMRMVKR